MKYEYWILFFAINIFGLFVPKPFFEWHGLNVANIIIISVSAGYLIGKTEREGND